MPKELYKETETRWSENQGREIVFTFIPAKVDSMTLGRKVYKKTAQNPEIVRDYFTRRVYPLIEAAYGYGHTYTQKPTKEQKQADAKRIGTIKTIIGNNILKIIESCLRPRYEKDQNSAGSYIYNLSGEILDPREQKAHNNAVFLYHLQRAMFRLTASEGMQAICEDYELAQEVQKDQRKFSELEKLCKGPLRRFMTTKRIYYMPEEDQYQEGLLAIWAASSKYEARNFARFSTFANQALNFKFSNLVRFFSAHKRRTQKHTEPMGNPSDPKDSKTVQRVNQKVHDSWRRVQRIQLSDLAIESAPDYDPFLEIPIIHENVLNPLADFETVLLDDPDYKNRVTRAVNSENFPHLNEVKLDLVWRGLLLDNRKSVAQWDYIQRMYTGKLNPDPNGSWGLADPSPLMIEVEQEQRELKDDEGWIKALAEMNAKAKKQNETRKGREEGKDVDELPF